MSPSPTDLFYEFVQNNLNALKQLKRSLCDGIDIETTVQTVKDSKIETLALQLQIQELQHQLYDILKQHAENKELIQTSLETLQSEEDQVNFELKTFNTYEQLFTEVLETDVRIKSAEGNDYIASVQLPDGAKHVDFSIKNGEIVDFKCQDFESPPEVTKTGLKNASLLLIKLKSIINNLQ